MQEYAQKPEKSSSDSNHKSSGQPPISEILQAYKNRTLQRMSVDDEELLQAKMRDKSSERETLQQYKDYTHRDKSRYNSFIQGMFDTPQRKGVGNEEPLQGKFDSSSAASESPVQREVKPNNTGLPDNLKSGIENLSGYSLDDVKVHYNSDKPAQLSALAYAQGTDIHVAPGQERHLPHEAWHVVQQKQGRVQPTMQMQGVDVSDNEGLEREADVMGEYGMNQGSLLSRAIVNSGGGSKQLKGFVDNRNIQRRLLYNNLMQLKIDKNATKDSGYTVHAEAEMCGFPIGRFDAGNGQHAEDKVIERVKEIESGKCEAPSGYSKTHINPLDIKISSSPCTSSRTPKTTTKDTGCAEELIALQKSGLYMISVTCNKYYTPKIKGGKESSKEAAGDMATAGIQF